MEITIPKHCHENWDAMTPKEKGRFCAVCNQTVRDFTNDSDEEILDFFAEKPQNVCGNFNSHQLNRNLDFSFLNSLLAKFAVGLTLTAGGWTTNRAQENTCNTKNQTIKKNVFIVNLSKEKLLLAK